MVVGMESDRWEPIIFSTQISVVYHLLALALARDIQDSVQIAMGWTTLGIIIL